MYETGRLLDVDIGIKGGKLKRLVVGFIGADQPGIVQRLSQAAKETGGNWLESQMVQVGGYFSGIASIDIEDAEYETLKSRLQSIEDLTINVLESRLVDSADGLPMRLNIIGPDRVGILAEVSRALADQAINVLDLRTAVSPAAMSGEPLFNADADVLVPANTDLAALSAELTQVGDELGVDVLIEEPEAH